MSLSHDAEHMLAASAALVNTRPGFGESPDDDALATVADLDAYLEQWPMTGSRLRTEAEVAAVRDIRSRVARAWAVDERDDLVRVVNDLFSETGARPYLARHDEWDWHLHVADPDQDLAHRIGAEAAMGLADLVRADDVGRLRTCAAEDCDDVLVDLSRNRSRRFCDSGNCANRTHVAAYRARRATMPQ